MTPKFLKNQLGRSLKNLGVQCVDVYYLHNPETQLSEVPKEEFLNRFREAFMFLESAVEACEIQYYGLATWNGFRQGARARCHAARGNGSDRAGNCGRGPSLPFRALAVHV